MATEYTIPITRRHYAGQAALEAGITTEQEWAYDETNERFGVMLSDSTYRYHGRSELFPPGAGVTPAVQCDADSDFYTTAWTDYSSSTTVTGFSSTVTKEVYYKKIGNLVFVHFCITGTSNATSLSFTLPDNPVIGTAENCWGTGTALDNGAAVDSGCHITGVAGTGTFNVSKTCTQATLNNWTGSGTKKASGTFFYEIA